MAHYYENPGIYINDDERPWTNWILNRTKTIETRNKDTLKHLVGRRVALVKTNRKRKPMVVGYATISDKIIYKTQEEFEQDVARHCVPMYSKYHECKSCKYGYVLTDVTPVIPTPAHGSFSNRSIIDLI